MESVLKRIKAVSTEKLADFNAKLAPGIKRECVLGAKVPDLRSIALKMNMDGECGQFLDELPHKYHEENMLHAIIISKYVKDIDECIERLESFLPYVDNWAVCDTIRPVAFKKKENKALVLKKAKEWTKSPETYTCRFGIGTLMAFFLDEDFEEDVLLLPSKIVSEEYYVNMMIAWHFATALAKRYNETVKYLENNKLPPWVHNKTIQKARESFRVSDEKKAYLKTLKRQV